MTEPRTASASTLRTPWTAADYPLSSPTPKGAPAKLADSGVAPLVAQARGFGILTTKEETRAFAAFQRDGEGLLRTARSLEHLLRGGEEDILTMPWFAPGEVYEAGSRARATEWQYRPSAPTTNAAGKVAKYSFLPGASLTLDVHPATPSEWIDEAPEVLVIEGLLKGDSVLTAQLLAYAGTADDLAAVEDQATARARLSDLMLRIPRSVRTLVVNAASVTGWDRRQQWKVVPLRGRRATVAFDGDLASNANVWRETDKCRDFLVRGTGQDITLFELWGVDVEAAKLAAGFDPEEKLGADDYLTRLGSWTDLQDLRTPNLPAAPIAERLHEVGEWRVSPTSPAIVEELVERVGAEGKRRFWETRSRIGARIERFIESRMPLPEEIAAGTRVSVPGVTSTQTVEVTFYALGKHDEPGVDEPTEHTATIPASALAASSAGDWKVLMDRQQMQLPASILTHPDFPPRNLREWLGAVKLASDPSIAIAWERQGWVPGAADDSAEPFGAFVIGDAVIAETVEQERSIVQGVTRQQSPNLGRFGVEDHYREMTHQEWEREMARELPETISKFMAAHRDPATAAIQLCLALTPSLPIRHKGSSAYYAAEKGSGKSHAASIPLSFWGARNASWDRDHLTGTGSDTLPATEGHLGRHVFWVIDDLAPSADASKAASREDTLGSVLRANFNGKSRDRIGEKRVPDPYATVAVTAENLPSVPSVRERVWEVAVPRDGTLTAEGYAAIQELRSTGALRRAAGYAVRSWTNGVHAELFPDWEHRMEACARVEEIGWLFEDLFLEVLREQNSGASDEELSLAPFARELEKAVALYRGAWHLTDQLKEAMLRSGMSADAVADDPAYLALAEDLPRALARHCVAARATFATLSPARNALRAIAALLATGKAHLLNPTTPGAPPLVDDADKVAAGWQLAGGSWRPTGRAIGNLGTTSHDELVAVLDGMPAFAAAQAEYPALIPHGSSADAAWAGLVHETGFAPTGVTVAKSTRVRLGEPNATTQTRRSLRGVAVRWDALQELRG